MEAWKDPAWAAISMLQLLDLHQKVSRGLFGKKPEKEQKPCGKSFFFVNVACLASFSRELLGSLVGAANTPPESFEVF